MAVVKADGYGHGVEQVAQTALSGGASMLGVALIEEGLQLRRAGITAPILVMGWSQPDQVREAMEAGLSLTVADLRHGRMLSEALAGSGFRAKVHIKIDTGMGRLGVPFQGVLAEGGSRAAIADVARDVEAICRLEGLEPEGIYTHFAVSEADRGFTLGQVEGFAALVERLKAMGLEFAFRHAANSGAIWDVPESHFNLVRAGISIYGYHPAGRDRKEIPLEPALSWKTAVTQVKMVPAGTWVSYGRTYVTRRNELLATLPVGYADGFNRGLSNKGWVLVRGRRVPVVGRVCMDQTVVMVSEAGPVEPGEEVVLIGRQGEEVITADEMAEWLGTISNEVLCNIGKRVPRLYRDSFSGQGGGAGQ